MKKCPYCDFNSHAVKDTIPETLYIQALLADLEQDLDHFKESRPIAHIFMGGGTPSLFSPDAIARLLRDIHTLIPLKQGLEITMEANPGTFQSGKFEEFHDAGINRLSIGIQSFNDVYLARIGRIHTGQEAVKAVEIAQRSGFCNLNLDLMFGLPGQAQEHCEQDILTAIQLDPAHISFYQLTIEPHTYFHSHPPPLPGEESILDSLTTCQRLLAEQGFQRYEISAYARPDSQCRHNVNYWQFGDYLGIGAGAHGKISQAVPGTVYRYWKSKNPEQYLQEFRAKNFSTNHTRIKTGDMTLEFLMNSLRLRQGFSLADYQARTGLPADKLEPELTACIREQLITENQGRFRCTDTGWNLLNGILERFMP